MPYVLGIDVGFDRTAAAVCRLDDSPEDPPDPEVVRLGERAGAVETVLYLERDGSVVAGEDAAKLALMDHRRVTRGFTERVGDGVPMVVGGRQYLAQDLVAALVVWVLGCARAQLGGPPEHVVVTHRAAWGPYRLDALHRALREFGVDGVTLLPAPVAAAESHGGELLAVCDLGGDTLDAAVAGRADGGPYRIMGRARSADPVHFDDAMVDLVADGLPAGVLDAGSADPGARSAMLRLRRECAAAARRLTTVPQTVIAVPALARSGAEGSGWRGEVQVSRAQFDERIAPALRVTADMLHRALRSAAVEPRRLDAVLLVGAPARLPAVAGQLGAQLPVRVAVDDDPELTTARGAALAALRIVCPPASAAFAVPDASDGWGWDDAGGYDGPGGIVSTYADPFDEPYGAPPPRPPVGVTPLELPPARGVERLLTEQPVLVRTVLTALAAGGVALTLLYYPHGAAPARPSVPVTTPPAAGVPQPLPQLPLTQLPLTQQPGPQQPGSQQPGPRPTAGPSR